MSVLMTACCARGSVERSENLAVVERQRRSVVVDDMTVKLVVVTFV